MIRHAHRLARGLILFGLAAVAWVGANEAHTAEVNFAGSIQLDDLLVPTDDRPRDFVFDGFTTELSMKLSVDVNEHISAQVKTCYGCHGFELGAAYVDFRPFDALRIRAGRFTPTFGDFPLRHDPANHLTSDKPLPYDMGRMLRLREFNMSILPAPYVDNGVEVSLAQSLGDSVDLDVHAYLVGGLRAGAGATDVDFIQSRSRELYYVDNNSQPTIGGRIAASFYLGPDAALTVGASGMYGTYDPDNRLDLLVLGADLVLRIERWALRIEYLLRRTRMDLGDDPSDGFLYGVGADGRYDPYSLKDGFYAETTFPIGEYVELVGRVDGMRRQGNVPKTSPLRSKSAILRYTLGGNLRLTEGWRVKLSTELYDFSDFKDELAIHLGVVGAF
ncbi:MAG: hypothetical protein CVU56_29345 [Deltaproteobacteria bacterium HGW-Deltaproteobacteria-14]|jgi:hypothetical protein|nr:MAG: hypothetical protein CVU56_29345 [Deltaproteobacteria bacterium HGW-Deltaproteobacteria-14]